MRGIGRLPGRASGGYARRWRARALAGAALLLVLLPACRENEPDVEVPDTNELTAVQLGRIGGRIYNEPERLNEILDEVGLTPAEFEALHFFIAGLKSVMPDFPGLPSNPPPIDFQVSDPNVLRDRLVAAGLREVTVDTSHREEVAFRSGKQLFDWCVGSNPTPNKLVAGLTSEQKASMTQHIDGLLRDRPILSAPLNIGLGIKP